ncbi:hypothetical protein ACI3KS_09835 [Microbacterium sp. ZW T5_45]|uniref:hypothetical protein n=1 Tax=Microbacterium sp. ZW T5_45 TaxID=3378080 RepID=UPI003853CECC
MIHSGIEDPWFAGLTVDPLALGPTAILMGASGAVRLDVADRVAARLGAEVIDAEALHPPETLAKVLGGDALYGDERRIWLDEIAVRLRRPRPAGCVVSCSPLRYMHRRVLRRSAPQALFFRLDDAPGERTGMPLIGSEQFYTTDGFRRQEQGVVVPCSTPARAAATILRHLSVMREDAVVGQGGRA